MRTSFAANAPVLLGAVRQHGAWLIKHDRLQEALQLWQEELARLDASVDRTEPAILKLRWKVARLLLDLERTEAAIPALTAVLADHQKLPPSPERDENSEVIRSSLGRALQLEGQPAEAEPHLARARAWIEQRQPNAAGEALDVRIWHGRCLLDLERVDEARRCLEAVRDLLAGRADDPRQVTVNDLLAECNRGG